MAESRRKIEEQIAFDKVLVTNLLAKGEFLDEDGYPTDDAITIIEKWHWNDIPGWFTFINSIWHLASWGWTESNETDDMNPDKKIYRYYISTAGWSGNETLIRAMQNNDMMWTFTWFESQRGGHYIFERNLEE